MPVRVETQHNPISTRVDSKIDRTLMPSKFVLGTKKQAIAGMSTARTVSFTGIDVIGTVKRFIKISKHLTQAAQSVDEAKLFIRRRQYDKAISKLNYALRVRQLCKSDNHKSLEEPLKLLKYAYVKKSDNQQFHEAVDSLIKAFNYEMREHKVVVNSKSGMFR